MAAQLFGVPQSLLHGPGDNVPGLVGSGSKAPGPMALRADAVMSGSNKVHIQATMARAPKPVQPKSEPEITSPPAPEAPPQEQWGVPEPAPEAPPQEQWIEAAPESEDLKAAVTLAVNLVTLELESAETPEASDDAVTVQSFQILSLKQLRSLCKHLALPTTGNKNALTERAMGARLNGPLPPEFAFLTGWYTKTL